MAIVVGVDGSPESREALRWALAEAKLRDTPLRVMGAFDVPLDGVSGVASMMVTPLYEPSDVDASEIRQATELGLENVFAEVAQDVPGADEVRVEHEALEGHAAEVLVAAADGEELLVVGSRGRGGFAGLLLGSVSQACVQHARCPVVIVRRVD
ncbi:MAG TPA: universal stress protein [Gaiellaceae bacterium]|nr:universal stress protein [Gaiellaceae bacterium]